MRLQSKGDISFFIFLSIPNLQIKNYSDKMCLRDRSTLFNALAGSRISIVEDTPGVTRDVYKRQMMSIL